MHLSKSEINQLELLNSKTPQERFHLMTDLINGQIKILLAGLKNTNPDMTSKELSQCFKNQMKKIYSLKH